MRKLGLRPAPIATQVIQRDLHAEFMGALSLLGAVAGGSPAPAGVKLTSTKHEVRLGISDNDANAYVDKLAAKRTDEEKFIAQLEGRLKNKGYVTHAPEAVVTQTRDQLQESQARLESIKHEMRRFGA